MLPYRIEASVFLWHTDYLEFSVDSFSNFIGKLLIINLISISSLHEIVLCFLQLEEVLVARSEIHYSARVILSTFHEKEAKNFKKLK